MPSSRQVSPTARDFSRGHSVLHETFGVETGLLLDDEKLAGLITRTAEGDREAFRSLYDQTSGWMLAISMKILRRRDLAEEAIQDAFVSIWKQAERYDRTSGSPRGWMATITRRRAIDRLRASPWLARENSEIPDAAGIIARLPERLALRQCLERLDARTRHSICLAYLYGLSHSELSEKTGLPLGTIKSRLRRGLMSLKECLEE